MTSPEGEKHYGWWQVESVDAPRGFRIQDGFGDAEGNPAPDMPTTHMSITLEETPGGTRMLVESQFPSREAMDQMIAMGMEEGIAAATGQIDAILADA